VSLNIKNERVCRLAKEAAALTGQSQVSVLEQALEAFIEERSKDAQAEERARRVFELLAEIHASITDEDRAAAKRFMEEMYDENGLPV
jgi:antitoxin VapB